MNRQTIGKWDYLRLAIAGLAGLFFQPDWAIGALAVRGVVVGFLNITGLVFYLEKENGCFNER